MPHPIHSHTIMNTPPDTIDCDNAVTATGKTNSPQQDAPIVPYTPSSADFSTMMTLLEELTRNTTQSESVLRGSVKAIAEGQASINSANAIQVRYMKSALNEMAIGHQGMVGKVDSYGTTLERLVEKVEVMEKKLMEQPAPAEAPASKVEARFMKFQFDNSERIWSVLPLLINGQVGIAGWIPVTHKGSGGEEEKLVVLSVQVCNMLIARHNGDETTKEAANAFVSHLKPYKSRLRMEDFFKIMMKTPFKPYTYGSTSIYTSKQNTKNYIIMDAAYFRGVLDDIDTFFPKRVKTFSFPGRMATFLMYQQWALWPRNEHDDSEHISVLSKSLTIEERKACPSMLGKWWEECYESGCVDFFGMEKGEDNRYRHIVNGVIQVDGKRVPRFKGIIRSMMVDVGEDVSKKRKSVASPTKSKRARRE